MEAIGDHIATDDRVAASRMVSRLFDSCMQLSEMAERYATVRGKRQLRKRVVGTYLIFCTVTQNAVAIVRIIHGAMDYERPLPGGE